MRKMGNIFVSFSLFLNLYKTKKEKGKYNYKNITIECLISIHIKWANYFLMSGVCSICKSMFWRFQQCLALLSNALGRSKLLNSKNWIKIEGQIECTGREKK